MTPAAIVTHKTKTHPPVDVFLILVANMNDGAHALLYGLHPLPQILPELLAVENHTQSKR